MTCFRRRLITGEGGLEVTSNHKQILVLMKARVLGKADEDHQLFDAEESEVTTLSPLKSVCVSSELFIVSYYLN